MKCIFIEGLPGSGKTTFAKRLYKDMKDLGMNVHSYTEGDAHPIDLAWIAIFTEEDLINLYDQFPSLVPAIQDELVKEDDKYLLAYTNIKIDQKTKGFYDYCEQFEIYRVNDLEIFLETHIKRYDTFVEKHHQDHDVYIFECVLVQNHINELIINYNSSNQEIHQYFDELMAPFKDVDIQVLYIKQNQIESALERITEERRSPDKNLYKDWIDHCIDSIEKNNKYRGYEGVIQYAKDRQDKELDLLKHIQGQVGMIPLDEDYEKTYLLLKEKVIKNLD